VWRRDLLVVHRTLDPDEAELVARIAAGGATIADVSELLARRASSPGDEPAARLVELLGRWLDAAVLAAA
jgi:hypothetical protein